MGHSTRAFAQKEWPNYISGGAGPLAQRGNHLGACLFTAAALLSADPAMLHLPAMALALIATDMADVSAGQEDGSRYLWIKGRLAGDDISSGVADVGTVKVQIDAAQ